MSVQKQYRITCDIPNCDAVSACVGETTAEALERAHQIGWSRPVFREDPFDCCPLHAPLSVRDIQARLRSQARKRMLA